MILCCFLFWESLCLNAIVKQEETFLNIKSARLSDHSVIFAAEIAAIRKAIQLAPTTGHTLICTDSFSAAQALKKTEMECSMISSPALETIKFQYSITYWNTG